MRGLKVRELREFEEGMTLGVALDIIRCEILLEASPVNLNTGNPGLSNCRTTLEHGLHLVLANKAPLALAQAELDRLARTAKWVYFIVQRFVAGFLCSTLLDVTWFAEKF